MLAYSVMVLLSTPASVEAQTGSFDGSVRAADEAVFRGSSLATQDVFREGRALPPVLSVLVPGTGQLAQEQRRGWAYLALEAAGWLVYADRRNSASAYRSRYRDLAWETARANGTERIEGDFTYYERLTQWERSGRYDRDPGSPGVQPETDPSTFNGSIWDRARRIYGVGSEDPESPGYRAALDYYRDLAYGEPFLWDWSPHPDARVRYASLIRTSDTRFQHATIALGFVIANHLISAADAFVSVRGLSLELAPVAVGTEIRMRWEWAP
jgi:hypothetical protein